MKKIIVTMFAFGLFLNLTNLLAATSAPIPESKSAEISDTIPLKQDDLLENNDTTWFPELQADPNNFVEDMDLPERADADLSSEKMDI